MHCLCRHLNRSNLYHYLIWGVTFILLGQAIFSATINVFGVEKLLSQYIVNQGIQMARNVANQSGFALVSHTSENAKTAIQNALAFPDVVFIQIIDAEQKELVSKEIMPKERSLHANQNYIALVKSLPKANIDYPKVEVENNIGWRFIAPVQTVVSEESPFEIEVQKPKLLGYVRIVILKETLSTLIHSLWLGNAGIAGAFFCGMFFVFNYLMKYLMRPLTQLRALMSRAEMGELGLRTDITTGAKDLVEMSLAFNAMMVGLEVRESELVRSRDEALRIATAKTQFAAIMSHEIRTPLNGVVGILELLGDMGLDEHQRSYWEIAYRSSESLMQLINDVLDFSKMEAGKIQLDITENNIEELMEDLMGLFMYQSQKKQIQIGYVLDHDIPLNLCYDTVRVRQILNNLLGNAIKFTETGEAGVWIRKIGQEGDYIDILIEVIDSGIGMPENVIDKVFESFSQADRSTTRKYGGTGLGLTISKNLVELMGSKISVSSELGKGSCFSFPLRVKAVNKPIIHASFEQDKVLFQDHHVLVIDESPMVRAAVHNILTRYGMKTSLAENVEIAWQFLEEDAFLYSFILLDDGLLDKNEMDMSMRIRSDPRFKDIPLFLLDRSVVLTEGCSVYSDGYLSKPLRAKRFIDVVRYVITGKGRSCSDILALNLGKKLDRPLLKELPLQVEQEKNIPIAIPVAAQAVSLKSDAAVEKASKEIVRVLIVDDNPVNRTVAATILKKYGFVCEHAENGLEALNAVKLQQAVGETFAMILMDCSMPEMDGYEATRAIRDFELPLGKHTPVIALTANVQEGDRDKCLGAGMDDYLSKPVTAPALKAKIIEWIGIIP